MPRINITEHSETYSTQVRNNNYATVALPICAIWGPAYVATDADSNPDWLFFEAGYKGTTNFVNTFKGSNTYLGTREKSYEYAIKLLAAGYNILAKRADTQGRKATHSIYVTTAQGQTRACDIYGKYTGTYGNQIKVRFKKAANSTEITLEVFDRNNYMDSSQNDRIVSTDSLLEVLTVSLDPAKATDSMPYLSEVIGEYIEILNVHPDVISVAEELNITVSLEYGTDYDNLTAISSTIKEGIVDTVNTRLQVTTSTSPVPTFSTFIKAQVLGDPTASTPVEPELSVDEIRRVWHQQTVISNVYNMISELTDTICYNWDCLFLGTMDDQYIPKYWLTDHNVTTPEYAITTLQIRMAKVAAESKCGVAFLGTPFGMPRGVQQGEITTGAVKYKNDLSTALGESYSTFAELVGPWCKTTLPISGANAWVTPELAHLLLIINAQGVGGINKWWMVPAGMTSTGVVHTPEYKIKQTYLDIIQNHDEGVCLNPLMEVPGKGFTCFGNSTLWDKPLGTYNALQNLSTRLLCNRVKQRIWDVALQILFKYNNENAYSHFYAGLSPLLDEMRSVGALTGNEYNPLGYKIIMNPDIINLDKINANTVIGKVYLAVTGVIDTVDVDLFLLPPTGFMESYD